MRKIVILDEDTPFRQALVTQLRQTAHPTIVLASDAADLVGKIHEDHCAAILVDTALLADQLPHVLAAVRTAPWRPLVLLVTSDPEQDLDPELVSLIIRKPYEVGMVTGILLAAIGDMPHPPGSESDRANPGQ